MSVINCVTPPPPTFPHTGIEINVLRHHFEKVPLLFSGQNEIASTSRKKNAELNETETNETCTLVQGIRAKFLQNLKQIGINLNFVWLKV